MRRWPICAAIGAADRLVGPAGAEFRVRRSRDRRALDACGINDGRLPWWIFDRSRRVPGTRARDYLRVRAAAVGGAPTRRSARSSIAPGRCTSGWSRPLLLAALNTEPREASAALAGAVVRETLARGGSGLPAADRARRAWAAPSSSRRCAISASATSQVRFGHRLRAHAISPATRSRRSISATTTVDARRRRCRDPRGAAAWRRPTLVPGLDGADRVPRHRQRAFPHRSAAGRSRRSSGVVNGTVEWMFAFPGRLSVTISAADRLLDMPRDELGADDLAGGRDASPALPTRCRRGRSCASGARPSRRRRRRTPGGPAPRTAVGQPVPRRRLDRNRPAGDASKARSAPATARPISSAR